MEQNHLRLVRLMAQGPTGMVECHVSGKGFVKKLETLLTSTLDQYTCVETDYKQSPEDETVSGACFLSALHLRRLTAE